MFAIENHSERLCGVEKQLSKLGFIALDDLSDCHTHKHLFIDTGYYFYATRHRTDRHKLLSLNQWKEVHVLLQLGIGVELITDILEDDNESMHSN